MLRIEAPSIWSFVEGIYLLKISFSFKMYSETPCPHPLTRPKSWPDPIKGENPSFARRMEHDPKKDTSHFYACFSTYANRSSIHSEWIHFSCPWYYCGEGKGINVVIYENSVRVRVFSFYLVKSNLACAQPTTDKNTGLFFHQFFQDPKIKKMLDGFKIPAAGEAWCRGKLAPPMVVFSGWDVTSLLSYSAWDGSGFASCTRTAQSNHFCETAVYIDMFRRIPQSSISFFSVFWDILSRFRSSSQLYQTMEYHPKHHDQIYSWQYAQMHPFLHDLQLLSLYVQHNPCFVLFILSLGLIDVWLLENAKKTHGFMGQISDARGCLSVWRFNWAPLITVYFLQLLAWPFPQYQWSVGWLAMAIFLGFNHVTSIPAGCFVQCFFPIHPTTGSPDGPINSTVVGSNPLGCTNALSIVKVNFKAQLVQLAWFAEASQ